MRLMRYAHSVLRCLVNAKTVCCPRVKQLLFRDLSMHRLMFAYAQYQTRCVEAVEA
jgi:hypothetical protein